MNTANPAQVLCFEEGNWFVAGGGLSEPLQGTEADCKRIAAALSAQARVVEALQFYADPRRYRGPNQPRPEGDEFTPSKFPYMIDVTRDGGLIARDAIAAVGAKGVGRA
jgi:hypothetical protein